MKLLLARELQDGTPRGSITPAKKRRVWSAREGLCLWCGQPVPVLGPEVDYDHKVPLALGGEDSEANLWPIHRRPCHKEKTIEDVRRIAKAKRQRRLIESPRRSKRPIAGKGFRKDLTRGFDGRTRKRT